MTSLRTSAWEAIYIQAIITYNNLSVSQFVNEELIKQIAVFEV